MINIVALGNLTRDPEQRFTKAGSPVTNFPIACDRHYKSSEGEKVKDVTYLDCETYGRTAELVAQYCQKGRQVLVQGRLRYRTWKDSHDQKRSKLSLVANSVTFLGGRKDKQPGQEPPAQERQPGDEHPDNDDVPFSAGQGRRGMRDKVVALLFYLVIALWFIEVIFFASRSL